MPAATAAGNIPLSIIGPTATGKSSLAMAVAEADDRVEIISADSMQVYRGMDIGTAKPTQAEQAAVQHHLIDIADPHESWNVAEFVNLATAAAAAVRARGHIPIMVGGTGLYVQAIVDDLEIPGQFPDVRRELDADPGTVNMHKRLTELDPVAAARMEPNNRRRVVRALEVCLGSGRPFSSFGPGIDAYAPSTVHQIACDRPRPVIDERIHARYDAQMRAGFLAEVETVYRSPQGMSKSAGQALGYKELISHLDGLATIDQALKLAKQRTRRFVRRQQSWFRRDPRIEWMDLEAEPLANCVARCLDVLRDSEQ